METYLNDALRKSNEMKNDINIIDAIEEKANSTDTQTLSSFPR